MNEAQNEFRVILNIHGKSWELIDLLTNLTSVKARLLLYIKL